MVYLDSLALTKMLADYMYSLFQWYLKKEMAAPHPARPLGLWYELQAECAEYASEAAFAYHHPSE